MSTIHTPVPSPLVGLTIPSDGDDIVAASVNPALEDLADGYAYLRRELLVQLSKFSAKNYLASDWSKAARDPFSETDETNFAITYIQGLAADDEHFWCTLRDGELDVASTYLVKTRDGVSYRLRATVPLATTMQHRAIVSRGDGWVVLGCASVATSAGQNIDVISPANVINQASRAAMGAYTNWVCGAFSGDRCYLFGARGPLTGAPPGGNYARVGSASLAGGFLDWDEPTGGILGGDLASASGWVCCAKTGPGGANLVLAVPRFTGSSNVSYLYVNADTNTCIQQGFTPLTPDQPIGLCVWKDRFWMARTGTVASVPFTRIYVSDDGISWTLVHTLPVVSSALVADGSVLVLFELFDVGSYPDNTGSYYSADGAEWEKTAVSSLYELSCVVAATKHRSAILRNANKRWVTEHDNLRISLGGVL